MSRGAGRSARASVATSAIAANPQMEARTVRSIAKRRVATPNADIQMRCASRRFRRLLASIATRHFDALVDRMPVEVGLPAAGDAAVRAEVVEAAPRRRATLLRADRWTGLWRDFVDALVVGRL